MKACVRGMSRKDSANLQSVTMPTSLILSGNRSVQNVSGLRGYQVAVAFTGATRDGKDYDPDRDLSQVEGAG
jgi:hypothetical protein